MIMLIPMHLYCPEMLGKNVTPRLRLGEALGPATSLGVVILRAAIHRSQRHTLTTEHRGRHITPEAHGDSTALVSNKTGVLGAYTALDLSGRLSTPGNGYSASSLHGTAFHFQH